MTADEREQWWDRLRSEAWGDQEDAINAILDRVEQLEADLAAAKAKSPRPASALSRDDLGRIVRQAWCGWAKNQPQARMNDSWLVPYEELSEPDKEVDRLIAEAVIRRIMPPTEETADG